MEYIALVVALIMLAFAAYTLYLCGNVHTVTDILAYEELIKKIKFWRAVTFVTLGIFIGVMSGVTP